MYVRAKEHQPVYLKMILCCTAQIYYQKGKYFCPCIILFSVSSYQYLSLTRFCCRQSHHWPSRCKKSWFYWFNPRWKVYHGKVAYCRNIIGNNAVAHTSFKTYPFMPSTYKSWDWHAHNIFVRIGDDYKVKRVIANKLNVFIRFLFFFFLLLCKLNESQVYS